MSKGRGQEGRGACGKDNAWGSLGEQQETWRGTLLAIWAGDHKPGGSSEIWANTRVLGPVPWTGSRLGPVPWTGSRLDNSWDSRTLREENNRRGRCPTPT